MMMISEVEFWTKTRCPECMSPLEHELWDPFREHRVYVPLCSLAGRKMLENLIQEYKDDIQGRPEERAGWWAYCDQCGHEHLVWEFKPTVGRRVVGHVRYQSWDGFRSSPVIRIKDIYMYSITYNHFDAYRHGGAKNPEVYNPYQCTRRNKIIHPELVKMVNELWITHDKCYKRRERYVERRERGENVDRPARTRIRKYGRHRSLFQIQSDLSSPL